MSAVETSPSERDNVLLRRPAVTTAALLAALLVPVAVVPYALTRRHIARLTHQIDHLVVANADLRSAISRTTQDLSLKGKDLARTASLLDKSKDEISLLRRDVSQIQTQLHSFQSATRAELQALLEEGKLTRHHLEMLPRLGLSLADVAAFMHEVELYQGISPSTTHSLGVERLRTLALKLQVASNSHES